MKLNLPKEQVLKYGAGAAGALLVLTLLVVWRVSKSHARARGADLLSASADMARCVGGDETPLELKGMQHTFRRRMITALPDVAPVSDCPQAIETVQEKLAEYDKVWFSSPGSKGSDGRTFRVRITSALGAMAPLPYTTPANRVLNKRDEKLPILQLPQHSFQLLTAVTEMVSKDGLNEEDIKLAQSRRLRIARKVDPQAPRGRVIATLQGKVAPDKWGVVPADKKVLSFYAQSDKDNAVLGMTEDGGGKWFVQSGSLPIPAGKDRVLSLFYGPHNSRWMLVAYADDSKHQHMAAAKVNLGATALPQVSAVPDPPPDWKFLSADGARQLVVLPKDILAYPMTKIAEKSAKQKKDEAKRDKDWQKHLDEREVQAEMMLEDARAQARKTAGIDDDHVRMDAIRYVVPGKTDPEIRELTGYGLAALVPGPQAQMVLGKDTLPSQVLYSGVIPPPDEPVGMLATATSDKPLEAAFLQPLWYQCFSSDGWAYGMTDRRFQQIGLKPGVLEFTFIKVDAPEGSHMGCGEGATVIAIPLTPDRIFAPIFTIRLGDIEGSKAATTSGTHIDEYSATVATGVMQGALVVGWIAEGYAEVVVSTNWGTEFGAPALMAEALPDGSRVSGLRFTGLGERMLAIVARESCQGQTCSTSFEQIASDDQAKTWKAF